MIFRLLRCWISHITRGSAIQGRFSYSHAGLPLYYFVRRWRSWCLRHRETLRLLGQSTTVLQAPSVSLPCTFVYILFLLIYLDIYLPCFSTDAPFWTILPTHYCLFTLLLKFFTLSGSRQRRDQFSWLRVATRNKAWKQWDSPPLKGLFFPWSSPSLPRAYRNSWHGAI